MSQLRNRTTLGWICVFILGAIAFPAQAKYSGGTGDPNDPYLIATTADLIALGATPADYRMHFVLTADIDLDPNLPGGKIFDAAVIAPWWGRSLNSPVGIPFYGVLTGNGHAILHLTIKGQSYLGLFGYLGPEAEVTDLRILDANVNGESNVGGLVGWNEGSVSQCCCIGTVNGESTVGGLVGANYYGGAMAQCCSAGAVNGVESVGGLAGANNDRVSQCYSTSTVYGESRWIGGLVGFNAHGSITQCYSAGPVSGADRVGGLVGQRMADGATTQSFWDTQTSGQGASIGGTGKTTTEMQKAQTFLNAGWDFAGETTNGTADIWWIDEGRSYPRLWWEPGKYGGGTGEPNDPYLIFTAEQLNAVGAEPNDWDRHFRLMADVDLSGYEHPCAVIAPDIDAAEAGFQGSPFSGVFDGHQHVVRHLRVVGAGYLGLFGQIDARAQIKNLGVADVNIIGSGDYIGAVVGYSRGDIAQSFATGTIGGTKRVGGLTGRSWGNITASSSTATVTADEYAGGLAAGNYGSIATCYSTGAVTANRYAGGLVGENYGTLSASYAAGPVSKGAGSGGLVAYSGADAGTTSSFWDAQTSGQSTSAGGTGKTTAEMRKGQTFLDVGWDLAGETANGTDRTWWIDEGKDYPRLWWQAADHV